MSKGLSLDSFAKGAMREMFNREMRAVAANISDPNTSATAKRKITITVLIAPDDERQLGNALVSAKTTLCPVKGAAARLVFGYDEARKEGVYSEFDAEMVGQISIDDLEDLHGGKAEREYAGIIDLRKSAGGSDNE